MSGADERWVRADRLFMAALDLPEAERTAFLDAECGDDAELRQLVEKLLEGAKTGTFLTPGEALTEGLLDAAEPGGDEPDLSGTVVDRYRLIEEIGRGGMAVVYRAERADGQFEQQVALKLIKRGIDTDDVVQRFARERQILARIRHPHIARLLDGGATDEGRPFFAMELVQGRPIDRYCDEQRLDIEQRLRLFCDVAEAVAHAHRNLVVHRDIKPSNILVGDDGEVRLLDFGIARVLEDDEDEDQLTRTRQRLLTPRYASPEQVRGEPVTTSSDVYQLGVLLYLLLTGRLPYRKPSKQGTDALIRAIVESEPTRPSSSVTDALTKELADGDAASPDAIGERRRSTPAQLRRELAGDLDNILLMALRKEPERRYSSVAQLIEDIRRHLDGRPVSARPDTLWYRTSKLIARHKVGTALAAAALLAVLVFSVTVSVQARRIAKERDRANLEAESAEQVAEFLVDLFRVSNPGEARGNTITAREVLDRGAERIAGELEEQPLVQARMMNTIGRVYQNLGLYQEARPLIEQSLELRRDQPDTPAGQMATSLGNLGWLHEELGEYDQAEPLYRQALDLLRGELEPDDPQLAGAINNLGLLTYRKGEYEIAEPMLREALALRRAQEGPPEDELGDSLANLGLLVHARGELDEAEALYLEAIDVYVEVKGEDFFKVAIGYDNLGRLMADRKDLDASEKYMRQGLELRRRIFGEDHPETADSLSNLASILFYKQDYDGAEEIFREVVAIDRRKFGDVHPDLGLSVGNLGFVLMKAGRPESAEPELREALEIMLAAVGDSHRHTGNAHRALGECLTELGRYKDAEPHVLAGYNVNREALGPDHSRTRTAAQRAVILYEKWGKPAEAERYRPFAHQPETAE